MHPLTEQQNMVLHLAANALFAKPCNIPENADWDGIRREAMGQTVLPLVYHALGNRAPASWKRENDQLLAANLRVIYCHLEVHEVLEAEKIPHVFLKGAASGEFYPDPFLRTMGDVDVLVPESEFDRAGSALCEAGFAASEDSGGVHRAFHRGRDTCELHRSVNGIPQGPAESGIRQALQGIFSEARHGQTEFGTIPVPDVFCHGLVLLLHTAAHLTSEGVGLRHLCDWAVFAAALENDAFCQIFEERLKAAGLWHFAQLLTLCAEAFLGAPHRAWAGEAEAKVLDAMILDILQGGNFGHKDADRYRQIKYIANRGNRTVDEKSAARQLWHTIRQKAQLQGISPVLVILDYGKLVLGGERKPDTRATLRGAAERKKLYREFHLFETEKDT